MAYMFAVQPGGTTGTWTSQANCLRVGTTTSAVLSATFDNIRIHSASMPGPG